MSDFVTAEIASQPMCWGRVVDELDDIRSALPKPGERVAVVGCGTSWFMAAACAALREQAGGGQTDAFAASEMPRERDFDAVVAITRSGATTEILELLRSVEGARTAAITAVGDSPIIDLVDDSVVLDFADERSIVQTRYATTALALWRAHLGQDLGPVIADGERALAEAVDHLLDADQVTFLGRDWTVGLACEAALKLREAAQFWSEAYPAMEYRHGPMALAQAGRVVWSFGPPPPGLANDVAATGAELVTSQLDPMAHLIVAQRLAVALARSRGLDPDHPRHLSRSVVLGGA